MTTVLIPHSVSADLYALELGRAYQAIGCKVIYGADNLLELSVTPDLIHLQWPEALYRWIGSGGEILVARIDRFVASLVELKRRGSRLAWTVHNLTPHAHSGNPADASAYQAVIDLADVLIHHCPVSAAQLREKYRVPADKPELILPFGNYLAYPNEVSRSAARARLGIPADAFVYLHFGRVRVYKGLDMLFNAFGKVAVKNKFFLVAGQYDAISGLIGLYGRAFFAWKKRFSRHVLLNLKEIPASDVQIYMNASDCLVLGHSSGLNSGVAVLGMTFGKLIAGPRIGCIGWVIEQGPNLAYEAGNVAALTNAMTTAASVDLNSCAQANRSLADGWRWENTSKAVLSHFRIGQNGESPQATL